MRLFVLFMFSSHKIVVNESLNDTISIANGTSIVVCSDIITDAANPSPSPARLQTVDPDGVMLPVPGQFELVRRKGFERWKTTVRYLSSPIAP
jgi:hypothetical protein